MKSLSAKTVLRRVCASGALAAASLAAFGAVTTHATDPSLVCEDSFQLDLVSLWPYLYLGDSGSGSKTVYTSAFNVDVSWSVDLTGSSRSVDIDLSIIGDGYYLQHTLLWYLVPAAEVTQPPTFDASVAWSDGYGPVTSHTTNYDFTNSSSFQGVLAITADIAQCAPASESSVTTSTDGGPADTSATTDTTGSTDAMTSESEADFPQTGTNATMAAVALAVVGLGAVSVGLSRRRSAS